jgi:cytochrome P450
VVLASDFEDCRLAINAHINIGSTFYETLRMYPPVAVIPKKSAEDTILIASNANGDTKPILVPAGSIVNINVPGLHYNRKRIYFSH